MFMFERRWGDEGGLELNFGSRFFVHKLATNDDDDDDDDVDVDEDMIR